MHFANVYKWNLKLLKRRLRLYGSYLKEKIVRLNIDTTGLQFSLNNGIPEVSGEKKIDIVIYCQNETQIKEHLGENGNGVIFKLRETLYNL